MKTRRPFARLELEGLASCTCEAGSSERWAKAAAGLTIGQIFCSRFIMHILRNSFVHVLELAEKLVKVAFDLFHLGNLHVLQFLATTLLSKLVVLSLLRR